MVSPQLVGHPESVFLYSGSEEVFGEHRATLASMGAARFLGTDPSLAVLYNTALLGMMYATMNGFLHATALVGSANVSAVEGVHADLPRQMATIAERAIAEGYGDKNYLAVYEIFKKSTPAS
ncbi:imine reductase family protein [Saccharopolyspora elongata]|uniref:imine reductase family protein n=1 Tax=Saccharopolyspora elongata TaxID=2530387 RepID=UPI001A9F6018|nr:hypothetical protein [Saccharopolyspora elongata]